MNVVSHRQARTALVAIPVAVWIAAIAACSTPGTPSAPSASSASASAAPRAAASLQPKSGSQVQGMVWFTQEPGGVRVVARISGLAPNRELGFHVHEAGNCASADGNSAGGHFNPAMQPHGPQDAPHHGGDMPSLKSEAQGNAEATFLIEGVSVDTGANGLIGRSVVVHAQRDDYKTQPSGNSGTRIACGVIEWAPGSSGAAPMVKP